jgi:TrmH family RNA methyltransferase
VVAIAEPKDLTFSSLKLSPNPLFLVLETIEKPGNLGAMLRTANAAKVDAVVVCDIATDVWNPNCIRASLGAVFGTPTIVTTSDEAIKFFKSNAIPIYVTWLEASEPYYNCPLDKSAALVMGTEAFGISDKWLDNADKRLIIPMYGEVDSLNVSNSAAIVLFEALRQRVK